MAKYAIKSKKPKKTKTQKTQVGWFFFQPCFKEITLQLKAFKISLNVLNRMNKVQVL